jgi:hypothetical protein
MTDSDPTPAVDPYPDKMDLSDLASGQLLRIICGAAAG